MASASLPANFQISEADAKSDELRVSKVYLHHAYRDPTQHLPIVKPGGSTVAFGATTANNWGIHRGPDPKTDAVVARAQGLHLHSGGWHNSFTMVFEVDGLKGSTLQVMGIGVETGDDQWAIVGGTGKFAFAQGVISKKLYKTIDTGNIIELDIHATFRSMKTITTVKGGMKGGSSGSYREPAYNPLRLESIKIYPREVIGTFEFTYIDQNGTRCTFGLYGGGKYSEYTTIDLGPSEFVKEVSGTIGRYKNNYDIVSSLKIVTNLRTMGPYGRPSGSSFSLPEKKGGRVVGFYGRVGEVVDALGVIVRE